MPSLIVHVNAVVAMFKSELPEQITGPGLVKTSAKVQVLIAADTDPNISVEDKETLCAACEMAALELSERFYGKKDELIKEFKDNLSSALTPASGLSP